MTTTTFLLHEEKPYLDSTVTNQIQKFLLSKKLAGTVGGKM